MFARTPDCSFDSIAVEDCSNNPRRRVLITLQSEQHTAVAVPEEVGGGEAHVEGFDPGIH